VVFVELGVTGVGLRAGDFQLFEADMRVCRTTRVRLRGHLEAYGVGGGTTKGRCKGVLWRGEGVSDVCWADLLCGFVTPCDLCRLEMARPQLDSLLLPCQG